MGDQCFRDNTSLVSISFGKNLSSVSWLAFTGCSALTTASFEALYQTSIGSFGYCTSLEEFVFPNNTTIIDERTFEFCENLKSIVFEGTSLRSVLDKAFWNCNSLTDIVFPSSLRTLGDQAFYGCESLVNMIIPNFVGLISYECFYLCRELASFTIGTGVTQINMRVFRYCTKLLAINYLGTKGQWSEVFTDDSWRLDSSITQVICSDGTIELA